MSAEKAKALGLRPRARLVSHCLVGVDPVMMLTGPIDATQRLFDRTGMTVNDMDTFEINEVFASVILAWAKEYAPDMARSTPMVEPSPLGHPVGNSGARLITTALHELERTDGTNGQISMCCGGDLGTGMIIERLS